MKNNSIKFYHILTTILLIWLLLHFFVINILQFKIGITGPAMTAISLWKEVIICIIWGYTIYHLVSTWYWRELFQNKLFKKILYWFIGIILVTIAVSFINSSIANYIIAFRYDLLPLALFVLFYIIWWIQTREVEKTVFSDKDIDRTVLEFPWSITRKYFWFIKILLVLGLWWYFVLMTLPWFLKIFWYDRQVYEWEIWEKPPAVYYSAQTHGIPRNQFIFERPIFYGFFLVSMRPIFYLLYIRRQKFEYTWIRWFLYSANVISTFSRSAWWVWIIQTILLLFLSHRKQFWGYIRKLVIPFIIAMWVLWYYFYYEIFGSGRQFSNTWHINAFFQSIDILKSDWLWWQWAGTNGPASHQLNIGFNSENQYLQMWIEYGIFGLIIRWVYYAYLNISWFIKNGRWSISNYFQNKIIDNRDKQKLILLWSNIWLIWLSICGLVLHSLADKMSIWPLMILYGLRLWTRQR